MKRRTSKTLETLLKNRFSNELTSKDLNNPNKSWIALPDCTSSTIDMIEHIISEYGRAMTGWRMNSDKMQYLIVWKNKGNKDEES